MAILHAVQHPWLNSIKVVVDDKILVGATVAHLSLLMIGQIRNIGTSRVHHVHISHKPYLVLQCVSVLGLSRAFCILLIKCWLLGDSREHAWAIASTTWISYPGRSFPIVRRTFRLCSASEFAACDTCSANCTRHILCHRKAVCRPDECYEEVHATIPVWVRMPWLYKGQN